VTVHRFDGIGSGAHALVILLESTEEALAILAELFGAVVARLAHRPEGRLLDGWRAAAWLRLTT